MVVRAETDGTSWYVQEGIQGYDAVGRFPFSGEWYDYEVRIENADFYGVVANFGDARERVEKRLREGAEQKARQEEISQAAKRLEGSKTRELIASHSDLTVIMADSLAVGNCELGTQDWITRNFPGATELKLSQLEPFMGDSRVRRVVVIRLKKEGLI